MADVRDWGKFLRGRWDWTRFGYENGFPRGCQFTDVDAAVEIDGRRLVIEPKHYDGVGILPGKPEVGQGLYLRDEVKLGKTVLVLYGCGPCNDPYAMHIYGRTSAEDVFIDWRSPPLSKIERRRQLKRYIDWAVGIADDPRTTEGAA
jgi:hypothetical protein